MPSESATDAAEKILAVIRLIPIGFVTSYSQIAARAGLPGRARLVARALKWAVHIELPWHRVIRADGSCAVPGQQALLEDEGVNFNGAKVDVAFWHNASFAIETVDELDRFIWCL